MQQKIRIAAIGAPNRTRHFQDRKSTASSKSSPSSRKGGEHVAGNVTTCEMTIRGISGRMCTTEQTLDSSRLMILL